ncbi:glycosyltransferase [Aestuariibaculum sp. M13]|uniref:glycosyltransferase family 2 protein n=1 Tax=Aestuariibaculum sp. M13 TaxID=2967132 RepID=UPI002159F455|nr:glycosyltransferase family 2 protein [Aestuariibaculum sp. M13]MCR8667200.1 glycosyltransferase [Aestuariibaculum sp. M13]
MRETKYSIIIPHKNSFESLKRLLSTIPKSDDFQVIVVDDNSEPDEKDKLVGCKFNGNVNVIFNKDSVGAGKARNIALETALGKWILFADADDFFTSNLEVLLEEFYTTEQDIVYFGTTSIFNDTGLEGNRHQRYMALVTDYLKDINNEDKLRYYYTPPWSKMIRREIVVNNKIYFEEIIASNDILFSLKLAYYARSITASDNILYIITMSAGSLTNSFSKRHFDSKFNAALRANKFLCSIKKKRYQQSILYFLAKSYKFGLKYMIYVICLLVKNRSNILIGFEKIFEYKKVLNQRENSKYLVKKD